MKKTFIIAKWEFIEKVRRRSFIISMIITPLLLVSMAYLIGVVNETTQEATKPVGILDTTGIYFNALAQKLESISLEDGQPAYIVIRLAVKSDSFDKALKNADKMVIDNRLSGYILINKFHNDSCYAEYRSNVVSNIREIKRIESLVNDVITEDNLERAGLSTTTALKVVSHLELKTIRLQKEGIQGETDFLKIFFTGYVLIMIMIMMIYFAGGMFVRGVAEEKTNRIMEILLSSTDTDTILIGKIIGLGFLGLFQLSIWSAIGGLFFSTNLISINLLNNIGLQLLYFLLSYILFTSIFIGIGSVVNTEQEAQYITSNITLILIFPIILASQVIQYPDSVIAYILSFFPLTTSSAMILRLNVYTPALWQILLTILIMIVSIFIMIKFSAKIFRIGILSYGKRPKLYQLYKWMKEKKL